MAPPRPARGELARASTVRHLHAIGSEHAATIGVDTPLIERAVELDVLNGAVTRLLGGEGGVVVLEAGAGLGKTALLDHVARHAAESGCLVRRAAPGPLERHFPFGVVRALLEAPLRDASAQERARLLEGAAGSAGALLLDGAVPEGEVATAIAHSVLWLCSAMAEARPLALVIDDAHWADRPSLEVLAYLARRIGDLPLLIAIAARGDDPDAAPGLVSLIGGARGATVLHPQPLTPHGAVALIHRVAPDAPVAACHSCHRAVAGNPWLLGELARQIAQHGAAAIDAGIDGAPPVTAIARNVVRRRLAELTPRDRAVVEAVAVIGEGAPVHVVAAVAGVPLAELGAARDALLAAGLLGSGGTRFAHSLIAAAIGEDLPRGRREHLHGETARALIAARADTDLVGQPPAAVRVPGRSRDQRAADARRGGRRAPGGAAHGGRLPRARAARGRAGRRSRAHARPARDGRLRRRPARLPRAPAPGAQRGPRPRQPHRHAHAARGAERRRQRRSRPSQLLERELAAEADPQTRLAIETAALDALITLPARHAERAARVAAIDLAAIADPVLRRTVLAHRAWLATERGTPDADACAALAREALEGDELLHDSGRRGAYHFSVRALVMTDRADEARQAIARLADHAAQRGSLRLRAAAAWYAADLALRCGRVAEAENDARLVFSLVDDDVSVLTGGAASVLVCALAERGAFDEARDLLRERGLDGELAGAPWESAVRHARARLWLAEGDYERAHDEALASGALRDERGRPNPTWTPWRSTAALALAHLGRCDEAIGLADAELALAERFGAPVPIVRAMQARAVAEPDEAARVALCERALDVAAGTPALLESVRLRLSLGSALAYIGRRVEARDALRPALADADAVGAVLLAARARRELVATGLRPRQAALEGAAALTPRQRQVCELAAAGKGNRAIAQELFLSIKTVETHLAAGYRKLGVNTRAALAEELAR